MASATTTQITAEMAEKKTENRVDTTLTQTCQHLLAGLQNNRDSNVGHSGEHKVNANTTTFINARFDANIQSLEQVPRLLAIRQQLRGQLAQQLEKARQTTTNAIERAESAARSTVDRVNSLEITRVDLLNRIQVVTSNDTNRDIRSISLVSTGKQTPSQLNSSIDQLCIRMQKLKVTDDYLRALLLADDLCTQAKTEADRAPKRALTAFADLTELHRRMSRYSHLSGHFNQLLQSVWSSLHTTLEKRFVRALEEIQWPAPIPYPHSSGLAVKLRAFRRAFADLLILEEPWAKQLLKDSGINEIDSNSQNKEENASNTESTDSKLTFTVKTGLPIQLMVDPLIIRFKFHFEGKRPTNRLDKPEWMFTHILNVINDHTTLLERECQPMVEQANLPWRAKQRFITELIGAVTEKLQGDMPKLVDHPGLLSHAIAEALSFDVDIRDGYGYRTEDNCEWKGTVNVMIGQKTQFKHWLMVEKEFALARYEEIINEEGAWEWLTNGNTYDQLISFSKTKDHDELSAHEEPRPTKSADSLIHLMEVVTERYRPLSRISDRIQFLLEIQITILDQYRMEIISKADVYERTRFGALSMMQRQARDQISGLTGLKLLSRWTDSLLYVQSAMRDWADDVFFLELWRDISQNAISVKASPTVDNTWSASPTTNVTDGHDEETTVFEEVIDAYSALAKRLQDLIVRSICQEVTHALKSYTRKRGWMASTHYMLKNADGEPHDMEDNELDSHDQDNNTDTTCIHSRDTDNNQVQIMEISLELARPLAELAQMINFLNDNLPRTVVTAILRSVAGTIDEWLWLRVVRTHQFGDAGARQLVVDFERGLASVGRQVIRRPERHYRKMRDTVTLYQLPTNRKLSQSTTAKTTANTVESPLTVEQVTYKLRKAIKAKETESAQLLLDRLNVYSLSADEALDVIERRITTHHDETTTS